jgi:HEAT repeat protein/tetratricopeptide (TPR) repeat protein
MAIYQSLAAFGVRQLVDGALNTVGLSAGGEAVVALLAARFTDHSRKLTVALQTANERAWKALEIALAGDSFWDRCKVVLASGDDKAFREQVRTFLDGNQLSADNAGVRGVCLQELRSARKNKLLAGGSLDAKELAKQAGAFAGFADPQAVLTAEWQAVDRMADELRQGGYANLAQLVSSRPPQGMPLLVVAVRFFFRRQVETDQELFHGLAFAQLERLGQSQDAGFSALDAALTQHGQRLESLLGEIQSVVVETHGAVLDLQDQIEGQSEQVRQIGRDVQKLLEQHQLQRRELRPGDSLSIRNDNERQLVKQLVARYRTLPEGDRKEVPSLLNAIGKLEVVAGDFDAAQKDFQAVALLEQDNKGKAEGHYNYYLASLERREWQTALPALIKAVKLDGKRFAPFPVGKYQPLRILGAGGFGVAFLCKHKYMDAQVVVKTLALEELGRDADKVFTEAQVLRQLEHPAIIRISECGYVDAVKKSRPYLLMDYFQGDTLEAYVKKNGPMAVDDLIAVGRQVADGLHAAHAKGILHRDVKPANLLIHEEEKGWKVKVIDFGLALKQKVVQKSANASTSKQSKTLIGESIAGTVDYAAPEQMGKLEGVAPGPYSDVYGWAKTCCYALFQTTQPLMKHWKSVPTALAELLEKCLDEDHTKRPQGFADVLTALDNMKAKPDPAPTRRRAERAIQVVEVVEETPKRGTASRLPLWIGGGAAAAAVFALAAAIVLMLVLRFRTAGTLVVEVDQPGAWVYVDGKQVAVTQFGDKERIEVQVPEGLRQLRVVKNGFTMFTKDFTIKSAATETIQVRLEPAPVAAIGARPPRLPERPTGIDDPKTSSNAPKAASLPTDAPSLIALLDSEPPFHPQFVAVMEALIPLKDEKGAEAVARYLADSFHGQDAARGLRAMGPIAEEAVAGYINHKDAGVRERAASLLKGYGTKPEVILPVMIADLSAPEAEQRKSACEWLTNTSVVEANQKEVARALDKLLDDPGPFGNVRQAAARAEAVWGDKDSVPALIRAMKKERSDVWQQCVDALVALKDERAVVPLILETQNFFHKDAARKALMALGPLVETALDNIVTDATASATDRVAACQLLADPGVGVGTAKSLPALTAASKDANADVKKTAAAALAVVKKRS